MSLTVEVPRLNANEDELMLCDVLVREGERVEAGQPLFVVESTKSTVEIEAERAGYVRNVVTDDGAMLAVGHVLCVITETADEPVEGAPAAVSEETEDEAPKKLTAKERLRRKRARKKAARAATPTVEAAPPSPSSEVAWVTAMRDALPALADEEQVIEGPLDGPLERGPVRLDDGAHLAAGATLICRRARLGPGARIARGAVLRAESIHVGGQSRVWSDCDLSSGEILIGDGVVVALGVYCDLSGGRNEDSRLILGDACLVGMQSYLNTCRELFVEREVAISPRAMIFTHSFWQSALDGYQPRFAPVRLRERSWIGAGCQVLPGVVAGEGSIAVSNSTVVDNVPAEAMVAGIPAQVLRGGLRKPLEGRARIAKVEALVDELAALAASRGCAVAREGADTWVISRDDVPARRIVLVDADVAGDDRPTLFLRLSGEVTLGPRDGVLDFVESRFEGEEDRVVHELRNFLRRQGIRFAPHAWDSDWRKGL